MMTVRVPRSFPDKWLTPTTRQGSNPEDRSAPSSSLQMNRTGSAGAPSLPESPLARSTSAVYPSPLAFTSQKAYLEEPGTLNYDDDLEDSEDENEQIYELWPSDFDAARQSSSSSSLSAVTESSTSLGGGDRRNMPRSGMQNVAVTKRERTAIQVC